MTLFVKFCILKKMFKNENKGIVFKARWFVRPYINTGVTIIFAWNESGYALSFHLQTIPLTCSIHHSLIIMIIGHVLILPTNLHLHLSLLSNFECHSIFFLVTTPQARQHNPQVNLRRNITTKSINKKNAATSNK